MWADHRNMVLYLKASTWHKNSHFLFDYEDEKVKTFDFEFPAIPQKFVVYRRRQLGHQKTFEVIVKNENLEDCIDKELFQLLTRFQINHQHDDRYSLNFYRGQSKYLNQNPERLKTNESDKSAKQENTYLNVGKMTNEKGEESGYSLKPGLFIKLGRVQYLVKEMCIGPKVLTSNKILKPIKLSMKYSEKRDNIDKDKLKDKQIDGIDNKDSISDSRRIDQDSCKICLQDSNNTDNFLINPCKCAGSCGTVHLKCLIQWITPKVIHEIVGGSVHYNFQKLECEICKTELPSVIEVEFSHSTELIELIPIKKPKNGNYVILEGSSHRDKSIIVIQKIPPEGIRFGRGNDSQIKISDITVSRIHAFIKPSQNGFNIFDNKSKFGTLVQQDNMIVQVGNSHKQTIQIGRTIITLDINNPKRHYVADLGRVIRK